MSGFSTKVYIVQRASGEVIGAKTAFGPAQAMAKQNAPARVLFALADKTNDRNVVEHEADHRPCNQLQFDLPRR